MPPRTGVEVPGTGTILLMGAHRHGSEAVTVKLVSVFPDHDPAHQAAIVVIDAATGAPAALMDGDAITAARTAAGSRLATRLLAREDADVLAVLGTGVQGDAHLTALRREREWAEIRVWGRGEDAARALAARHDATPAASAEDAVARRRRRLHRHLRHRARPPARSPRPGRARQLGRLHHRGPRARPRARRRALVVVESRESALAPPPAGSTDLEGAEAHAELGELVAGTQPGRTSAEQLTLYKSVGVALEDDAAARLALRGAEERGLGRVVEI